jgi:hypothetical protein
MADYTRRALLGAGGLALVGGLAGCSDEDEEAPGLYAVDVLALHREGDEFYEFPEEVGVRVTVENTANEFREGTLVVTVRRADAEDAWVQEREVSMGRARSRTFELAIDVGATEAADFEAEATFE